MEKIIHRALQMEIIQVDCQSNERLRMRNAQNSRLRMRSAPFRDVALTKPREHLGGEFAGRGSQSGSYPDDGVQLRHGHLLGPVDRRGDLLLVLKNDTKVVKLVFKATRRTLVSPPEREMAKSVQ